MKLFKKVKKGFTLIELVVVIAVIAILAAVSVVSYISITNKAKQSNDQQRVDQINLAIKAAEISKKPKTMHEALDALKEEGFLVENLKAEANKSEFAYCMSENKFVILEDGKTVSYPKALSGRGKSADIWRFTKAESAINDGFSYYLLNDASGSVTVKGGLDVGDNSDITSVTFDSSDTQEVTIRTNKGTTLNIVNGDVVKHYGYADLVDITKVSSASYHEFGIVGSLSVDEGKVDVESTGYIAQATVNNSASLVANNQAQVGYLSASENATVTGANIGVRSVQIEYTASAEENIKTYTEDNITKTALFVSSESELNSALNGTTDLSGISKVVLANDFTITHANSNDNVKVLSDSTFDLNGHTITCNNAYNSTSSSNGFFFVSSCDFRIVDTLGKGKIVYNNEYACNVDLFRLGQSSATKNTTFYFDSGILEFNSSNSSAGTYCVDAMDNWSNYTVSFIMNGGSILCNGSDAEAIRLYDNGGSDNANRNVYVEINNGYLTGDIYFQGLPASKTHKGEATLVINGGTLIAARPIRSTQWTMTSTSCWGNAVITLNGGNIISTSGFGDGYLSYKDIIGTSYNYAWDITGWTAERIFNITDNR